MILELRAEEELQRVTAAIPGAIYRYRLSPDGTSGFTFMSPGIEALSGDTSFEARIHPDDRELVAATVRSSARSQTVWSCDFRIVLPGEQLRWLRGTAVPELPAADGTFYWNGILTDVTHEKRLEAVASAVNMMDQAGFVFSAIRHELGNPVNSIKTALSVLREQIDSYPRETVIDYLDRTLAEIGRVEYLLKVFKTFNLFEHPRIEAVAIDRFLDNFLGLLGNDCGKRGVTVSLQASAGLGDVLVDPRALNQALLNLVTNAVDAVEKSAAPLILLNVQRRGRRIFLQVEDNGHGMEPEQLAKLFHPFFTTKPQGNGLGLAIVKKLVTKMGGTVDVVSARGAGTTVTLSLIAGEEEA